MSLRRNVAGAAGICRALSRCLAREVYWAYMYDNHCNRDGLIFSGAGMSVLLDSEPNLELFSVGLYWSTIDSCDPKHKSG